MDDSCESCAVAAVLMETSTGEVFTAGRVTTDDLRKITTSSSTGSLYVNRETAELVDASAPEDARVIYSGCAFLEENNMASEAPAYSRRECMMIGIILALTGLLVL